MSINSVTYSLIHGRIRKHPLPLLFSLARTPAAYVNHTTAMSKQQRLEDKGGAADTHDSPAVCQRKLRSKHSQACEGTTFDL